RAGPRDPDGRRAGAAGRRRAVAARARRHSRRGDGEGLERDAPLVRPVLRQHGAGRGQPADPDRRLPAAGSPAGARDHRGDAARAHQRGPGAGLPLHQPGRPAGHRGRLLDLHLLARGCADPLRRRGAGRAHLPTHAAAREPRGAVQRGARPAHGRLPRELPAGVHAHRTDQHGPDPRVGTRTGVAALAAAVLAGGCLAGCGAASGGPPDVTLAATTTIEDSGLLAELLHAFEREHPGLRVRALTGGTGQVLELGRRGDVDVILSHDPAAESAFVAAGSGAERRPLMYNDFLIAGPPADPAGIHGLADAAAALRRIAAARAPFISRADDSGTHRKERQLWAAAGLEPGRDEPWYSEAGLGMGDALRVASERRAYILTDRATYLVMAQGLELVPLVEGDPRLANIYGAIRVRGRDAPAVRAFVAWITSEGGHAVIGSFGREQFGQPLFLPGAPAATTQAATPVPQAIR